MSPQELRPLLLKKIDALPDADVLTLHRVMTKLEAQRLWDQIKTEGVEDRKAGKFDSLNQTISEVRAELAAVK